MQIPRLKKFILRVIINETRRCCPPTKAQIERRYQLTYDDTVQSAAHLKWLVEKGYVHQPYSRGPYIPIREEGGERLALRLLKMPPVYSPFAKCEKTPEDVDAEWFKILND